MKLFQFVALILITTSFAFCISTFRKTHSETYATATMTTEEGAQVHQKITGNQYGSPIEGDFLIHAPEGKYMLTSNIREWLLVQLGVLGVGLLFLMISFRKKNPNKTGGH